MRLNMSSVKWPPFFPGGEDANATLVHLGTSFTSREPVVNIGHRTGFKLR